MRTFDRGVSRAKPRPDVEGGCSSAADDDVVCVGVVFATDSVVGGSNCNIQFSLFSRLARDRTRACDF